MMGEKWEEREREKSKKKKNGKRKTEMFQDIKQLNRRGSQEIYAI